MSTLFEGYDAVVLADHPVGYWPLSEKTGQWAFDRSGNGNTGQIIGGVTLGQPGVVPGTYAMEFDGNNGYITVGIRTALQLTSALSMEMWINTNGSIGTAAYPDIVNCRVYNPGYGGYHFAYDNSSTAILYELTSSTPQNFDLHTVTLTQGTWHHVIGTFANGTMALYLDGTIVGALAGVSLGASGQPFQIGAGGDGYAAFTGNNTAIYSHALSPSRIAVHYNAGIRSGITRNTSGVYVA